MRPSLHEFMSGFCDSKCPAADTVPGGQTYRRSPIPPYLSVVCCRATSGQFTMQPCAPHAHRRSRSCAGGGTCEPCMALKHVLMPGTRGMNPQHPFRISECQGRP